MASTRGAAPGGGVRGVRQVASGTQWVASGGGVNVRCQVAPPTPNATLVESIRPAGGAWRHQLRDSTQTWALGVAILALS